MNSPPGEPDAALQAFLAGREAVCPGCSHGLRGLSRRTCPECGLDLLIELRNPRHTWMGTGFVLLMLAWISVASTMNQARSARAAIAAHRDSTGGQGPAMIAQIDAGIERLRHNRAMYEGAYDGVYDRWIATALQQRSAVQARYPTYGSAWEVVRRWPAHDQFGVLWAGVLWLGSLSGLICFAILRVRTAHGGGMRLLKRGTVVLFAIYAGWHIVRFAIEASGW